MFTWMIELLCVFVVHQDREEATPLSSCDRRPRVAFYPRQHNSSTGRQSAPLNGFVDPGLHSSKRDSLNPNRKTRPHVTTIEDLVLFERSRIDPRPLRPCPSTVSDSQPVPAHARSKILIQLRAVSRLVLLSLRPRQRDRETDRYDGTLGGFIRETIPGGEGDVGMRHQVREKAGQHRPRSRSPASAAGEVVQTCDRIGGDFRLFVPSRLLRQHAVDQLARPFSSSRTPITSLLPLPCPRIRFEAYPRRRNIPQPLQGSATVEVCRISSLKCRVWTSRSGSGSHRINSVNSSFKRPSALDGSFPRRRTVRDLGRAPHREQGIRIRRALGNG